MESPKENSKKEMNDKQFSTPMNTKEIVPNDSKNVIEDDITDITCLNISQHNLELNLEETKEMNFLNSESLVTLKDLKSNSKNSLVGSSSFVSNYKTKNKYKPKILNQVTIRTTHFKNQHSKYINKKLESYRCNKRNVSSFGKMKSNLCSDSVLNSAYPTRRIKREFAKENIFGLTISQQKNNVVDVKLEADKDTLTPGYSFSSQNDICQGNEPLESERKEDDNNKSNICSDNSQNNLIVMNNNVNDNKNAFATGVVNVVVAQVNNTAILDYSQKYTRDHHILQGSLTSDESFISQLETVNSTSTSDISRSGSKKDYFTIISSNESSSMTLTPSTHALTQTNLESTSDHENFVIAKTSSYFKSKNNINDSIRTLTPEGVKEKPIQAINDLRSLDNEKPTLLDTIINMRMYPNIAEKENQNLYMDNCNHVIITDENLKTKHANTFENDYNYITPHIISNNIDKKTYKEDDASRRNRIYLPDENAIRDILTETEKSQKRSCAEESRNFIPIVDLWEKLSAFLDNAIRKLEESIMEKIRNELKQVLSAIESNMNIKQTEPDTLNESLQCCLVSNEIIDELTFNLNTEDLSKTYKNSLQTLHKKIEHVLDIIKPVVATRVSKDTEISPSVAVSLSDGLKMIHSTKHTCIGHLILGPIRFIRENFLVVISVPIFCFALFLIYCFLFLIIKIW